MQRRIIAVFFLAGMTAVVSFGCRKQHAETVQAPRAVETAPVLRQSVVVPIHAVGTATCRRQLRLAFKTAGYAAVVAEEGHRAAAGELLARLDVTEIEQQVRQARSAFEKAQRDYRRAERLYEGEGASREQLQNAETALQVAESTLRIAEFNLEHSQIKAPCGGIVLKRLIEAGEMVGPGTPVIVFGEGEPLFVRAALADLDAERLSLGDRAEARFAFSDKLFTGRVTRKSPSADPQTGLFEVEVTLDRSDRTPAAGMIASLSLFPKKQIEGLLVPLEAVTAAEDGRGFVFTVHGDTAVQMPVVLGPVVDGRVVIQKGLEGVTRVVTVGASLLRNGERVRVQASP